MIKLPEQTLEDLKIVNSCLEFLYMVQASEELSQALEQEDPELLKEITTIYENLQKIDKELKEDINTNAVNNKKDINTTKTTKNKENIKSTKNNTVNNAVNNTINNVASNVLDPILDDMNLLADE